MACAWALISAKQCVLVSDCVVFVREMVGRWGGYRALTFCDTVRVRWGRLPIRLCWVRDGGVAVSRPFFYFRLVWLVCDDAGWRVLGR